MQNWIALFVFGAAILALGCSGKTKMVKELTALETELAEVAFDGQGMEEASLYLAKVREFVDKYPQDTLSARYLFVAIGVARGLGDFTQAIALAEETWNKYPETQQAPEALFMQGFIYDSDVKDVENGRKYYQMFLDKYPTHPLTHNAKDLMGLTEKDPEELVKEFQKDSVQMDAEVEVQ